MFRPRPNNKELHKHTYTHTQSLLCIHDALLTAARCSIQHICYSPHNVILREVPSIEDNSLETSDTVFVVVCVSRSPLSEELRAGCLSS